MACYLSSGGEDLGGSLLTYGPSPAELGDSARELGECARRAAGVGGFGGMTDFLDERSQPVAGGRGDVVVAAAARAQRERNEEDDGDGFHRVTACSSCSMERSTGPGSDFCDAGVELSVAVDGIGCPSLLP